MSPARDHSSRREWLQSPEGDFVGSLQRIYSPVAVMRLLREWVASEWWQGRGGVPGAVLDVALAPAEAGFRAIVSARNAAYDQGWRVERVPVPVISVGNLAVGGAGKTPFAAWLAGRIASRGWAPGIALRGYGADEVMVHRELNPHVPVFAAARRVEAARAAVAAGCDALVLDDGFQHRALGRDLDVVLVSAEGWRGRTRLFPRGPWREGLRALGRADLLVVTCKSASPDRAREVGREVAAAAPELPVVIAELAPTGLVPLHGGEERAVDSLAGREVLAVAALADPEPFFANLAAHGARVEKAAFPDHHAFTADEADALGARAGRRPLVMTRKDAVKLRALLSSHREAYVLQQTVRIVEGEDAVEAALDVALAEKG
jgi:tetraacyldisaccharide 4'-kinase